MLIFLFSAALLFATSHVAAGGGAEPDSATSVELESNRYSERAIDSRLDELPTKVMIEAVFNVDVNGGCADVSDIIQMSPPDVMQPISSPVVLLSFEDDFSNDVLGLYCDTPGQKPNYLRIDIKGQPAGRKIAVPVDFTECQQRRMRKLVVCKAMDGECYNNFFYHDAICFNSYDGVCRNMSNRDDDSNDDSNDLNLDGLVFPPTHPSTFHKYLLTRDTLSMREWMPLGDCPSSTTTTTTTTTTTYDTTTYDTTVYTTTSDTTTYDTTTYDTTIHTTTDTPTTDTPPKGKVMIEAIYVPDPESLGPGCDHRSHSVLLSFGIDARDTQLGLYCVTPSLDPVWLVQNITGQAAGTKLVVEDLNFEDCETGMRSLVVCRSQGDECYNNYFEHDAVCFVNYSGICRTLGDQEPPRHSDVKDVWMDTSEKGDHQWTDFRCGCGSVPTDLVFALAPTGNVSESDWQKMLEFTENVIDAFPVGLNKTRIGFVTLQYVDSFPHPDITRGWYPHFFHLNTYDGKEEVIEAVRQAFPYRNKCGIHHLQDHIRHVTFTTLDEANGHRYHHSGAPIVMLVTDGVSDSITGTIFEADRMKKYRDRARIFAVRIGDAREEERALELTRVVSQPSEDYYFHVERPDDLSDRLEDILGNVCRQNTGHHQFGDGGDTRIISDGGGVASEEELTAVASDPSEDNYFYVVGSDGLSDRFEDIFENRNNCRHYPLRAVGGGFLPKRVPPS